MSVYRHYKNLPYRLLHTVKHSETLEDLVLYETLYPNEKARYWVRPKTMFFEEISWEGRTRPRFEKVELECRSFHALTDELKDIIDGIGRRVFSVWDKADLDLRTEGKKKLFLLIGYFDGKPVAFKLGFELAPDTFYSWLGGVDPDYHGYGFAYHLAGLQHAWVMSEGFLSIQTKCLNFNLPMLRLNLKLGFLVIDTESTRQGLKLILEKRIGERLA